MSRNRVARAPADCAQLLVMSKKRVPKGTLSLTGKLHSFGHPSTKFQQNQKRTNHAERRLSRTVQKWLTMGTN